jgi:hypothetical protein
MDMTQDTRAWAETGEPAGRGLLIAGGLCAILWPLLTMVYYAAYPVAAGGAMLPHPGGPAGLATRAAGLGQRPAVLILDWTYAALPLLLWPFFAALYRRLGGRGQRDLWLVAIGLGFVSICLTVLSTTFTPTLFYALARAYVDAGSEAEGSAILSTWDGLIGWMRGLNQASSLLYLGCVALISLGLIRGRLWRVWG